MTEEIVRRPEAQQLLKNQLCFPLYAASRLVQRLYNPMLEPFGLTYPQYIVLMILWEDSPCTVSHIGRRAMLNSNTLTPLLKRLEQQGRVERSRDTADERAVRIALTKAGEAMRSELASIPARLYESVGGIDEEVAALKRLLDSFVSRLAKQELAP